ncbi:MAG: transglycosylase SLT domain-containing protein [marine benthic group bacterium]|nr:transglycosylase SLT domain-containing protein [Gemmatimonadota bacterium]
MNETIGKHRPAIGRVSSGGLVAICLIAPMAFAVAVSWTASMTATLEAIDMERERSEQRALLLESELAAVQHELTRTESILAWSEAYGIPADLASAIQRAAVAEGLEPELGFRLVRHESGFRQRAVSPLGAIGYTQLLPSTAMWLEPGLTESQLYDRDTNLRLGFRYLKQMLDRYGADARLALLAYNRGPAVVSARISRGQDPGNGFADRVLGAAE